MTDTTTDTDDGTGAEGTETEAGKTFTENDVARIVRERLAQQAKNKFGDYDELKSKAAGAQTVEQKLAELEQKHAAAEVRVLRSDIAAKFKIDAEDRELFLTGTDEETLTKQAKRLADRDSERKKQGNHAAREGTTTQSGKATSDIREFTRNLFGDNG